MKILHLYDGHEKVYAGRGSVPGVVWNLARETASQGHDVTVLERQWDGLPKRAEHEGVTFERVSLRTGASEPWERIPYEMVSSLRGAGMLLADRVNFAVQAFRRLRDLEFDVVHLHLPFAGNVLATIAPQLAGYMIYTAHIGEIESRVTEPRFSPDAYLSKRIARTIVLNPEMREAFQSRGVDSGKLIVIPNGVEIERFQDVDEEICDEIKDEYGLHDKRIVLFVGTITPRKGVKELMQAAERVLSEGREDVRIVVVGKTDIEPDYTETIEETVESSGIEDSVICTGFVPEEQVPAFYDIGDVFVLPSFEEGSSIAVTEAIATGTPVVGSRIDGIAQQIEDGVHGRLVDPGDVNELANAIDGLLAAPEQRAEMQSALEDRREALSWPRVTEQIVDVYQGVKA